MTSEQGRAAQAGPTRPAGPAAAVEPAGVPGAAGAAGLADAAAERPGDPVCLLRRVCQACGAVAETDPPTVCPQCGTEMPGT